MKKSLIIIAALVILITASLIFWSRADGPGKTSLDPLVVQNSVQEYLKENISELSSQKEVLGGKFYITNISFNDQDGGIVEYEDGHIAVRSEFKYSIDDSGKVIVTLFRVLPESPSPKETGISFDRVGNAVQPEAEGNWFLVYEEPGKPALRVRLLLGDLPVSWRVGDRLRVIGEQKEEGVVVSAVTKL